jgi:hypothetical protein
VSAVQKDFPTLDLPTTRFSSVLDHRIAPEILANDNFQSDFVSLEERAIVLHSINKKEGRARRPGSVSVGS